MSTVEERVAAGAAWLDEHKPGWEREIDLATLDLGDSCRCILGQVYGYYTTPLTQIFDTVDFATKTNDLGFIWTNKEGNNNLFAAIAALDEAWISLIKERFNTGNLSD